MLKNGNRFGDPLAIPDGYSIKLTGDADETGLVGSNAVAAYSGGDKLIKARSIGLYYVAGAGLTTAVSDYVVSSVAMSDGCDTLFNHIEYDAATAACTPDASTGLYNKATVYLSGLSRKKSAANGKIESYYYLGAGGTPPFMPDNQDMSYPALFKGLNYHTRIYDAGNNLVSSETDTYSVFQPSLVRGVKGYYVRPIRAGSFRDGATSEVTTVYNDHGLPSESEAANFNSNGGSQRIRLRNVYASSVYPDLAQQNNLTAVYQTTTIVNGVATSSRAAAWARCAGAGTGKQGFNYPKWAAQNTYRALAANAGSLPAGAAPDPTLWLKDSTVLSRDSRGLVQEFTAASQLRSTVFDSPGRYAVAGFVNASPYQGQAGYIGFEAYESLSQWGMTGEILNNAGPRNTGYGVLGRGKNPAAFIRPRDYNPRPGSKYLVSAWVNMRPKGTGGLGAHIGFAQLAPGIKNEDRKVIAAPETSQWQYIEYVTASPDPARVPYVQCDGLIDDFIFRPLDSAFSAVVYHPVHQVPLAVIGLNGDVVRTFYDDNLEPVASVAADGNLLNYSARRYSRDGAADFDAANPNMALTLQPRSGGKYPGRILNGELPLTQAVPGDCVNYGAVAKFARRKDVTLDLTVADIRITGRADGFYCKAGNAPEQKLCDPGPTRLMVLKLGPKALVIADLKLLAVLPSAAAGPVVFASKGGYEQDPDWRFDNAAVLFEPRIDVTYMDGYGRPIQMQTIEGNGESKVVTQTVYDGYGAPAVTTKPIRVNGSSWSYVPDVVASIDWTSGIMRGKAADYCRANRVETQNDNDWQYPYAWSRRESSPLARKVRGGAPGSNYSFASNYAVRVSFDRNDPNITALRNALSLPDNPYLQETSYYPLSDTRQTPVARLFDLQNNLIAVRSGSSESPIMSKNILDISPKDGTVSAQLIPPNSFNYGGHPSYEFRTYEGRLARRDDIDSGTKQYIYERATGLLRFMMDSAGAALQPDRINYFKYDSLNRITEAGYVGSNWDIGTLQNLADTDPKWPLTGVWRTRWSYDQAADQNCDYMKGRLASILSRGDAGKTVTDSFRYDIRGRAVSASRAAGAYDGKTRVIGYSYDNFGNVLGIAYPDNALQLVYGYNRNGQLLSIGIAGAPQLYASYSYNVDGSINSAALNNGKITRSFGYDFQGKLVKIDMQSLFKENIKWHTPTGIVEGGRIAQIDLSGSIISAPYSIAFDYDEHGRLTKAASDQAHKNLEVGTVGQASFDANGNILASSRGAAACAYQYIRGANKIMQCNSDSYHFNANGDLLDGRGMAFTYDPCSGLVTSINCDNLALTYSYSGSGQRVLKTATGSANYRRLYIHGLNALPLMEETSTDKTYYIYGPEDLLAIEM